MTYRRTVAKVRQARYVQVKASGDDMDDPKLYVDSKPGRPPK